MQIEREQWRRRCRRELRSWAIQALSPEGYYPARHHDLLCEKLEAVSRGDVDRLMVFMPPGSAKSVYVSRLFVAWWFRHHPFSAVIAASNNSDLAQSFGRKVRNLVHRERETLGYSLTADSKSAGRWDTSNGGEYYAAGINGGQGTVITGRRIDLGVIDDPVSGRADAQNEKIQNKIMDWYRTEFYTRLKPGARIILVMTRWSELDLGGQLLDEMGAGGDEWDVLNLPALAEDVAQSTEENPVRPDPLGRAPGEPLWPEWEDYDALTRKRIAVGEADWQALYQQRPKPPAGTLFDVDKITRLTTRPREDEVVARVRAWDQAETEQQGSSDPDWTVGVRLARLHDNRYVVEDVRRERLPPHGVMELIKSTAESDGRGIQINLNEEPGAAGKTKLAFQTGMLSGYTVSSNRMTGSKETRADPVISQCNVGNLMMLEAKWSRGFVAELRDFPHGRKDDQVDALSDAFGVVGLKPGRMRINPNVLGALAVRR